MLPFPGLHVRLEYDVQWDTDSDVKIRGCMVVKYVYETSRPYASLTDSYVLSTMSDGHRLRLINMWVYGGEVCLCDPKTIRLTNCQLRLEYNVRWDTDSDV